MGYYKYRVFDQPNTAYSIFMAGIEPYMKFDSFSLGMGLGIFSGVMWDEVLGIEVTSYRDHNGYSAWGSIGWGYDDIFELNTSIRWHHFTDINNKKLSPEEELSDDVIVVVKAIFSLKLF